MFASSMGLHAEEAIKAANAYGSIVLAVEMAGEAARQAMDAAMDAYSRYLHS